MNGEVLRGVRRGDISKCQSMDGLSDRLPDGLSDQPVAEAADGPAAEPSRDVVREVSLAVSQWVDQVGRFLGVVQAALEQSRPSDDATAEVRAVAGQLPALVRQCRAQVPTPEMIRTWVKSITEAGGAAPDAHAGGAIAAPRPALGVSGRFDA